MKAIIMEIQGERCVALKQDGTFLEMKNRKYTVGQEITLPAHSYRKFLSMAACLLLVCMAAFSGHRLYYTPVSYIYMDINPSIRLDLNCFERVIAVVPLNADAETLLTGASVPGSRAETCMEQIVNACREQEYINETNTDIEISVRTEHAKVESSVEAASAVFAEEELLVSVHAIDEAENQDALTRSISAKRLRALKAYTETFGGSLDENMAALKGISSDEIFAQIRAQKTAEPTHVTSAEPDALQSERPTAAKPSPQVSSGNTKTAPLLKKNPSEKTSDSEQKQSGSQTVPQTSKASEDSKTVLPERRLQAIRQYTHVFGGSMEENIALLRGVSTEEIYEMLRAARAPDETDADTAPPKPSEEGGESETPAE